MNFSSYNCSRKNRSDMRWKAILSQDSIILRTSSSLFYITENPLLPFSNGFFRIKNAFIAINAAQPSLQKTTIFYGGFKSRFHFSKHIHISANTSLLGQRASAFVMILSCVKAPLHMEAAPLVYSSLPKKRYRLWCSYWNDTGPVSFEANALGPGSDIEKYIFAALVVPKSRLDPEFCTLLKASRNI